MASSTPEQIKKHRIGVCWDTAAMTDAELSAGFRDVTPKSAKGYRKFVYDLPEKAAR